MATYGQVIYSYIEWLADQLEVGVKMLATKRDLGELKIWQVFVLLVIIAMTGMLLDAWMSPEPADAPPDGTPEQLRDELDSWRRVPSSLTPRPPLPPPSEIVALRVYPIKSCRGFEVRESQLSVRGLQLDRNWMLVERESREFLTIRSDPSMTLITTRLIDTSTATPLLEITINHSDQPITIPAFPTRAWLDANATLDEAKIWGETTDGWEYSDAINTRFSAFFARPVALVYKGPKARNVAVNGREKLYGRATPHHFADVMSLLVASEASMRDLNKQLGHASDSPDKLTIERFRPNIIVRGRADAPWEEDTWKRVRVVSKNRDGPASPIALDAVARCARCQVPNVDPATAEKHKHQPWKTLMQFRRVDQGGAAKWKPCFGMLCIPKAEGLVKVGDLVETLETTDKHLYDTRAFKDL